MTIVSANAGEHLLRKDDHSFRAFHFLLAFYFLQQLGEPASRSPETRPVVSSQKFARVGKRGSEAHFRPVPVTVGRGA
jgi:hypothetical protein